MTTADRGRTSSQSAGVIVREPRRDHDRSCLALAVLSCTLSTWYYAPALRRWRASLASSAAARKYNRRPLEQPQAGVSCVGNGHRSRFHIHTQLHGWIASPGVLQVSGLRFPVSLPLIMSLAAILLFGNNGLREAMRAGALGIYGFRGRPGRNISLLPHCLPGLSGCCRQWTHLSKAALDLGASCGRCFAQLHCSRSGFAPPAPYS